MLHAVKHGGPDAAAGRAPNHDASVDPDCTKVARQVGAEKSRGILLHEDGIALTRGDAVIDLDQRIVLCPSAQFWNLLGEDATIAGVLEVHLRVEDWNALFSRGPPTDATLQRRPPPRSRFQDSTKRCPVWCRPEGIWNE